MTIHRVFGACVSLVLAAGCASVQLTPQASIAKLEQQRAADPKSVAVLRALGIQYYKQQRYAEARATLTQAATMAPNDGVVALYLGLSAEGMNDLPAAKAAYSTYLTVGRTQRVRAQLEARLAAMQRRELQDAAKAAVQREATISLTPGTKTTVAVMPFSFTGPDSSLKPLERGFAELVTTDLSRVKALTVVDRSRLQSILDEIKLQQTGAVDSTTTVRAGKLIQAGTLVQGSILQTGDRLRADAALVSVATSQVSAAPNDEEALARLFEIEKIITIRLIDALAPGQMTVAERDAIEQRPTKSLQAFLAYSRGLQYEDQGRFDDASRAYGDAAKIDPSFGAAVRKSVETRSLALGNSVNSASVEAGLKGSSEGAVVTAATQGSAVTPTAAGGGGAAQAAAEQLNPSTIAAATSGTATTTSTPQHNTSTGTGSDNPAAPQSKVIIVIKPPTD
jgi:TolB-like protein